MVSSSDSYWKLVISFLSCAFLVGGKNLIKNLLPRSFQEEIELVGKLLSHVRALSLSENENNLI